MNNKKSRTNSATLSIQIKRAIGYRILLCFVLAMTAFLLISFNDVISGTRQLEKSLEEQCTNLESFVISQAIIKNEDSIKPKFDALNQASDNIKITWETGKKAALEKKIQWIFPFSWVYVHTVKYIDGTNLGNFVVTGSVFLNYGLFTHPLTKITLLLIFFAIIFIVLYPLGKRIPEQLFVKPINNLLLLLRNGRSSKIEPQDLLDIPIEIKEIRNKITILLKDAEERSREAALGQIASQVAHDIRSPLAALDLVIKDISNVSEEQRVLIRNSTNQIYDIANNLLTQYKKSRGDADNSSAKKTPELIADLILSVVSEKRVQYKRLPINFVTRFEDRAHSAFVKVLASDFKRVISNLLNNSVEALKNKPVGIIDVILSTPAGYITIIIRDNGCGMSSDLLQKIIAGDVHTQKENGNGLGLSHAIKMVEHEWYGQFAIQSCVNEGTKIDINLNLSQAPDWFASELSLLPGTEIVILDDDESIHNVWHNRIGKILPNARIVDFYDPHDLIARYQHQQLAQPTIFLIDFELIGYDITGLEVIIELNFIQDSYLVTSVYDNPIIRQQCSNLGVKIIPKNIAAHIPIRIISRKEVVDLIIIDDNQTLTDAWMLHGEKIGKYVAAFNKIKDFKPVMMQYEKSTPIYIDVNMNENISGLEFSKELYENGFLNLYLATGYQSFELPEMPWIKGIVGKEPPFERE